jgi:hypothetical protein
MESQDLQLLKNFEEDSEWFHKNIERLRQYDLTERFVAIKNKKPIASDKNVDVLIDSLEKKGENPSMLFIEFVHPEGYTLIL